MQDAVDAGVTWKSEAIFQEQIGNPISYVDIPDAQNTTTIYAGAEVGGALIRKRRGLGSISFVLRKRWQYLNGTASGLTTPSRTRAILAAFAIGVRGWVVPFMFCGQPSAAKRRYRYEDKRSFG